MRLPDNQTLNLNYTDDTSLQNTRTFFGIRRNSVLRALKCLSFVFGSNGMAQLGLPRHLFLKKYLEKIIILVLLVVSVFNLFLYINSKPRYVNISSQRRSDDVRDTSGVRSDDARDTSGVKSDDVRDTGGVRSDADRDTRGVTFVLNTSMKENIKNVSHDSSDSNTFNVNLNVNVNHDDISKAVQDILDRLEAVQVKRKSITNGIQNSVDTAVTTRHTQITKSNGKLSTELKYLFTLFTTWIKSKDTQHIHRNTLRNWASFKPSVNVIIFTDDLEVANEAKTFGCRVLRIPKTTASGLPILKHMYLEAMRSSNSYFYGFANSDILFTDGLVLTLLTLTYKMRNMFISSPVFVTGNRWNVPNITENEILRRKNIEGVIKQRGSFFMTSAEEYFITSYKYPWKDIPDLAIGVVAYDNWLVMNARMNGHYTVDTTKTILALHQDLDKHYYKSHFRNDSSYNENLLKSLYQTEIPYHKGFANCIEIYTDFTNDSVVIEKRNVEMYCND